jgi:hypothetical protein
MDKILSNYLNKIPTYNATVQELLFFKELNMTALYFPLLGDRMKICQKFKNASLSS